MRHYSARGNPGRQNPISGIPRSFAWILILVLGVASVPFALRPDPVPVKNPPPDRVVTVETQIQAEGADSHHRVLPFTVYILSHQLSWKMQSVTDLEGDEMLLSPDLAESINRARDVFCVGTASSEGTVETEEQRAAQRAAQLARWITTVIRDPARTRLFTLNAGQYRGPPELDSARQRKAILIVTGDHDEAVDLGEGLASGLARQAEAFPVVNSLLRHYTRSRVWLDALSSRQASRKTSSAAKRRVPAGGHAVRR